MNVLSSNSMNLLSPQALDNILSSMSHAQLYDARMNANPHMQAIISPYEHRAFAREYSQESPFSAAVSLPFAIPAYTMAKAMGLTNARSPASLNEIIQGYKGLYEGLTK